MAINFKELNDKLENEPITNNELISINQVEEYIDKVIKNDFKGEPIMIELAIANFTQTISGDFRRNLAEARRLKMYKELTRRYNEAGWLTTEQISNYRDYWVLTGKK